MKKIFILLAVASTALSASSQLKVVESGQVQVGYGNGLPQIIQPLSEAGVPLGITPGTGGVSYEMFPDSLATFRIIGPKYKQSGGRIAFGGMGYTYIAEEEYKSDKNTGKGGLILGAKGGLAYYCNDTEIFRHNITESNPIPLNRPVYFNVPISAPRVVTSSDARLKSDIEPLENMGVHLMELSPVSYRLIDKSVNTESGGAGGKGVRSSRSASTQQHQYGFIAQEVREVYPELVYEDEDGMLSIDYTGFIPILVEAVKNMQSKIIEQEQTIETLKNGSKDIMHGGDGTVVASLSQNRPNPFRATTVISCVVPKEVSEAFLCVYDLNGNQKLRKGIPTRGNVDITIDGSTLNAGMYIYTLIADGLEVDSKRMILTD